ncbi:HAMP domain-containing histidine kinase [Corynebacterium sp. TA-R-1]|uniref:histidine kinase n=1 Tax=Corynebacterium stercoris TaxID=2943490 RepID=A0ABT1G0T6_9CORY|nr:HAMP domain-containing histidine kinase [Corynebacterium stercoris]
MILRQSAALYELRNPEDDGEAPSFTPAALFGSGLSLRAQLAALTGMLLVLGIVLAGGIGYWAATAARNSVLDMELNDRSCALVHEIREIESRDPADVRSAVSAFKEANPLVRAAVSPTWTEAFIGDPVPVGGTFIQQPSGDERSTRSIGDSRVVALRTAEGEVVALAQHVDPHGRILGRVGGALLLLFGLGVLLTTAVVLVVPAVAIRPFARLKETVDDVTRTGELRFVPVEGDDELASVSRSFNDMVQTLQKMRTTQAQLVADAGHELKTPLTSMRTNIELLLLAHRTGRADELPAEEREAIERDVIAQMDEMTALISSLVDLAREEAPGQVSEEFRLDEVLDEAAQRCNRRRPDLFFDVALEPWLMYGDRDAMLRAPLNIIDNAAKWSPPGGRVRISLEASQRRAVLMVDDSGPGIPPEERERVFHRFYRATETRSTPGSGLGLAITKQVLERHDAKVYVEESDDGGARFRVVFPGRVPPDGD